MDNGQKARYYAAILSEYGLWSVSTGEQFESSFLQEVILHFDSECISSQQNLKLTEVSKLICICHSLHLHSIDSKFQNGTQNVVSRLSTAGFMFGYARYCIRSIAL